MKKESVFFHDDPQEIVATNKITIKDLNSAIKQDPHSQAHANNDVLRKLSDIIREANFNYNCKEVQTERGFWEICFCTRNDITIYAPEFYDSSLTLNRMLNAQTSSQNLQNIAGKQSFTTISPSPRLYPNNAASSTKINNSIDKLLFRANDEGDKSESADKSPIREKSFNNDVYYYTVPL